MRTRSTSNWSFLTLILWRVCWQPADSGSYECELHDGSLIGGRLHPSVASDEWMGRTLDLSRAYKQLGIDEKSRRLSVVGYQHLDTWKYFLNHVLPFGAAASVYSFNRVSKSLHHILCKLLFSLTTCFYDDFQLLVLRRRHPFSPRACLQF